MQAIFLVTPAGRLVPERDLADEQRRPAVPVHADPASLLLGAEKLKMDLAEEIKTLWHVNPLEGYGCTETGPVVSVNAPNNVKVRGGREIYGMKLGTVGRLLAGTMIKTTDPDTDEVLPYGSTGMVWAKGPQIMEGYLDRPELTAKVLVDGWYMTGDVGFVDEDGFLSITGRLARFAKIAGEMVPHHGVESALAEATGAAEGSVVVISVPDLKRGEKLAVFHLGLNDVPIDETIKRLNASSLPKLWIPGPECFIQLESILILATGKIDLRSLKDIATEKLTSK